MIYLYEDNEGNRIKDDEVAISEVMQMIRSDKATSISLKSDIGQSLRPRRPVLDGEDGIFLEITTVTWSSRNEWWPLSKFTSYLEAGFLVVDGGEAYDRWIRPTNSHVASESRVTPRYVNDPLVRKIVIRKAVDLEAQLRSERRLVHADGMRHLLETSDLDSPSDVGVLRDYTAAVKVAIQNMAEPKSKNESMRA